MAKKKNELSKEFTKVEAKKYPLLIFALVLFLGAMYFILSQLGIFQTSSSQAQVLDVESMPIAVKPALGADTDLDSKPDVLEKIIPCREFTADTALPGENCLIPYYSPGADPIPEPDGRLNPFENI